MQYNQQYPINSIKSLLFIALDIINYTLGRQKMGFGDINKSFITAQQDKSLYQNCQMFYLYPNV